MLSPDRRSDDVFAHALRNRNDITDRFYADYGGLPHRLRLMGDSEVELKAWVRLQMERARSPSRLFRLDEVAGPFREEARLLLDRGDVAAFDGTDAVPPITYMTTSSFVVAVGHVTRRIRGKPAIVLTETSTRYLDPESFRTADDLQLRDLCNLLDGFRENGSWSTTFREYAERQYALAQPHPVAILDGPIFTQNLLTQTEGRNLYTEMLSRSGRVWIGIIKDAAQAVSEVYWCSRTIDRGEGFVVGTVGDQLTRRYQGEARGVNDWISSHLTSAPQRDAFVRVVYRPGEKAFAFECRLSDLGLATAILLEDASPTLHHETPLLLETIDAQMRGGFRGQETRRAVIGRLMQANFRSGIDATHERELR